MLPTFKLIIAKVTKMTLPGLLVLRPGNDSLTPNCTKTGLDLILTVSSQPDCGRLSNSGVVSQVATESFGHTGSAEPKSLLAVESAVFIG